MKKPIEPNIKEYQTSNSENGEYSLWTAEDCGKFSDDMRDYETKLKEYNRILNETDQDKIWLEVLSKIKANGLVEVKSKFKIIRL